MCKGSCLCGAVQFEVSEFSTEIYKCHCSLCRKLFGGASGAAAWAPEASFKWLKGQEEISKFQLRASYGSCFCSRCGSVVPAYLADYRAYWIPVGLLDEDPGLKLTHHLHVASKAPWEILDDQAVQLSKADGFEL